jgi:hypothetical protein
MNTITDVKKRIALSAVLVFVAATAFAHAGHAHNYMGTVTMLHGHGEFMMKTTDAKTVTIKTTNKTMFTHADNHAAKLSELKTGMRVVVKLNTDGKTAASVKMSAAK